MFLTHKGEKLEDVELLEVSVEGKDEPRKQGNVIYFTICPNVNSTTKKTCKFYSSYFNIQLF